MTEEEARQERAARNQALFRDLNTEIVSLNATFEPLARIGVFVCECAHMSCLEAVEITLGDYQRVRSDPRRFIVAPSEDHVVPEAERVVERHDTHFVVEKIEVAAEVAEELAAR